MNFAKYIGLPFQTHGRGPAYDCWGLVRLFYKQEFGIELPCFISEYGHERDIIGITKTVDSARPFWSPVVFPRIGDVILCRINAFPLHTGVMINRSTMLHITKNINSCVESIHGPVWSNRIEGFFRYVDFPYHTA